MYTKLKKFSDLSKRSSIKDKIISKYHVLIKECGGDEVGFLKYIIGRGKCTALRREVYQHIAKEEKTITKKISKAMNNCNIYYKQLANYKKKQFLSCFTKVFSNRELKNYGWGCSDRTIAKARSHFFEKGCGVVPTNKNNYIKNNSTTAIIESFLLMDDVSHPSPNKSVKINKKTEGVQFLNYDLETCFTKFKSTGIMNMSESCFRNNIPKYFKSAKKETDKCPICAEGRLNSLKMNKLKKLIEEGPSTDVLLKELEEKNKLDQLLKEHVEEKTMSVHVLKMKSTIYLMVIQSFVMTSNRMLSLV